MFRETSPVPYCMAFLCYMIHYGTYNYRGAVVGLRGAVVGVRGAAVGFRGAAVGNIGIPTYVISRGAVVRQPKIHIFQVSIYLWGHLDPIKSSSKNLKSIIVILAF